MPSAGDAAGGAATTGSPAGASPVGSAARSEAHRNGRRKRRTERILPAAPGDVRARARPLESAEADDGDAEGLEPRTQAREAARVARAVEALVGKRYVRGALLAGVRDDL